MSKPQLSIIIPTFNRREMLRETILSLFAQTFPKHQFEIIVVDNDSTDGTDSMVEELRGMAPCSLLYHKKNNEGPGKSRNVGISLANGEVVAFTDSDCVAHREWLQKGAEMMTKGVGIVQGKTLPSEQKSDAIITSTQRIEHQTGLYETCNIFYRKCTLEEVSGFAEEFVGIRFGKPGVGGEDTDLAFRVMKNGWEAAFAPEAVVFHHHHPSATWRAVFNHRIFYTFFYALPTLVGRHPELRRTYMYKRIFWTRENAYFEALLFSLALGALHPLFWIATLFFSRDIIRHSFRGVAPAKFYQGLAVLALRFVAQMYVTVLLMLGSLRYRSLVL